MVTEIAFEQLKERYGREIYILNIANKQERRLTDSAPWVSLILIRSGLRMGNRFCTMLL